ncbi:hypothetical protein FRB96_003489 [Tulasnella sp. 330]|nr:hypothetical protein FRB96_003489 [Tulasnella sp. 330]KAG8885495.1 hypothetical protein FRB97_000819 [Tulasnella sp. 331]KAG8890301.1 hypothetical protein FRB98_009368 [Tulasnella sp. 332]
MASSDEGLKPVVLALPSISPSLALEVLPYGLTIHRILVNGDGKTHDIVIGPNNHQEHKTTPFLHTLIGRYSNRIPVGDSTLEKDGVTSQLSIASTESPEVSLHGGADGFDKRVLEVVDKSETTNYHLFSDAEKATIKSLPASSIFKLTSPAGDQGFPGELQVEVLLALTESAVKATPGDADERELGSIIVVYRARLAEGQKKTVTPINLTQHWGFNLDASLVSAPGQPTPDVKKHELDIKGSNRVALRHDYLATGELIPTPGTEYEHSHKLIGTGYPPRGYDEYYMFDKPTETSPVHVPLSALSSLDVVGTLVKETGASENALVSLASNQSGIRLMFETNQPGVQFYSANPLSGNGSRKRIHGGEGANDGYQPGAAAFLEFHEPLAAWLHPWGQSPGKSTLLGSNELYNNFTKVNVYFKAVLA